MVLGWGHQLGNWLWPAKQARRLFPSHQVSWLDLQPNGGEKVLARLLGCK